MAAVLVVAHFAPKNTFDFLYRFSQLALISVPYFDLCLYQI